MILTNQRRTEIGTETGTVRSLSQIKIESNPIQIGFDSDSIRFDSIRFGFDSQFENSESNRIESESNPNQIRFGRIICGTLYSSGYKRNGTLNFQVHGTKN